jgi:hypothetical protein
MQAFTGRLPDSYSECLNHINKLGAVDPGDVGMSIEPDRSRSERGGSERPKSASTRYTGASVDIERDTRRTWPIRTNF